MSGFSRRVRHGEWQFAHRVASVTCMYEAGQVVGPTSLPKAEVAALEWMSREVPREALILATYPTGNPIPRLSGQRVFIGEDKLTGDLAGRQGDVERATPHA